MGEGHILGLKHAIKTVHLDRETCGRRIRFENRRSEGTRIPSVRPGYSHHTLQTNILLARLTFKAALRRLAHTNLALLDRDPSVLDRWADWMDSSPPRWFLSWSDPTEGSAVVEVDAETLTLKHYGHSIETFGGEPWPTTVTHARPVEGDDPEASPDWSELKLEGVERDPVIALVRAVLPEAREFCAQIGPPFPTRFKEADLLLKDSTAGLSGGRIWLRLRLKSGFMISYHQGRVVGVYAPDTVLHHNYPELDGMVRRSEEYCGPIRLTGNQAAARIRDVAVNRLGLPRKGLWLDSKPAFWRAVDPAQTNGLRRYVVVWERPETEEERERRMYRGWPRDASVWGEVDAVSGELKSCVAGGEALAMPDPVAWRSDGLPEQPREQGGIEQAGQVIGELDFFDLENDQRNGKHDQAGGPQHGAEQGVLLEPGCRPSCGKGDGALPGHERNQSEQHRPSQRPREGQARETVHRGLGHQDFPIAR
jgi:hypothetical protein